MKWKYEIGFGILAMVISFGIFGLMCYSSVSQRSMQISEIQNEESNPVYNIPATDNTVPSIHITDEEREYIHAIVAGEAEGESIEGKMGVAQCIANAMYKDKIPPEAVRVEYKYDGWNPDLKFENEEAWLEVEEAVSRVFDDGEIVVAKPILYFYAPDRCSSSWHENLEFAIEIGNHRFFYLEEDILS